MPDDFKGSELTVACHILREAMVPADMGTKMLVAEVLEFEAPAKGGTQEAADWLLGEMRKAKEAGEVVNRFWFTDQRYKPQKGKMTRGQKIDAWEPHID